MRGLRIPLSLLLLLLALAPAASAQRVKLPLHDPNSNDALPYQLQVDVPQGGGWTWDGPYGSALNATRKLGGSCTVGIVVLGEQLRNSAARPDPRHFARQWILSDWKPLRSGRLRLRRGTVGGTQWLRRGGWIWAQRPASPGQVAYGGAAGFSQRQRSGDAYLEAGVRLGLQGDDQCKARQVMRYRGLALRVLRSAQLVPAVDTTVTSQWAYLQLQDADAPEPSAYRVRVGLPQGGGWTWDGPYGSAISVNRTLSPDCTLSLVALGKQLRNAASSPNPQHFARYWVRPEWTSLQAGQLILKRSVVGGVTWRRQGAWSLSQRSGMSGQMAYEAAAGFSQRQPSDGAYLEGGLRLGLEGSEGCAADAVSAYRELMLRILRGVQLSS